MGSGLAVRPEPAPILACTVSRNVHRFGLLIEDMEQQLGEAWGDLSLDDARAFLDQPEADHLEFIAIAVNSGDERDIGRIGEIIAAAKARNVRVILIPDNLSTAGLHELLRFGADSFVPYPLAEGALTEAIAKVKRPPLTAPEIVPVKAAAPPAPMAKTIGSSAMFAVQSLAGGTGASTLAVNLAWELANIDRKSPPSVCLIDLDLQYGSVATYLDLPRREIVLEMLQDPQHMDADAFKQAMVGYESKLSVFTAPTEMVPLDIVGPEEITALLDLAAQTFDIIVIDMPKSLVLWTETVLNRVDVYFGLLELDLRSAQNAMRFIKALKSEGLPLEKMHYVLNRAPGMTDLNGKTRMKKMAESLGVKIATQLPDGGKQVMQAGDNGEPLASAAKKNPLRREILKLAEGLHKAMAPDLKAKG